MDRLIAIPPTKNSSALKISGEMKKSANINVNKVFFIPSKSKSYLWPLYYIPCPISLSNKNSKTEKKYDLKLGYCAFIAICLRIYGLNVDIAIGLS